MERATYSKQDAMQVTAVDGRSNDSTRPLDGGSSILTPGRFGRLTSSLAAGLMLLLVVLQVGCSAGGYAGGGISSLSASTVTIDAGQSFVVGANGSGSLPLQWALTGAACTGNTCGTLSPMSSTAITYTAPALVNTPSQMTLNAAVAGTRSAHTATINVNPAPAIVGNPTPATVGVPYSFQFTTTGGTAPVALSVQAGTLPAGLVFNPATNRIAGTPTVGGSFNVALQLVDASDVPFTLTATKKITVGAAYTAASLMVLRDPLPSGVVGLSYRAMFQAAGGSAPYTWSLAAGSLPAGLVLDPATGNISGTPQIAGVSSLTARVTDGTGATALGTFAIAVTAADVPAITVGKLINGTVNVPYAAPLGAAGGTAPYTCTLLSGTLPAGLTLNPDCTLTGTPTTAVTVTFVVQITDSANPARTSTGTVMLTIDPSVLTLGTNALPDGNVGVNYTASIAVSGGTAPYTCSLVSGTLPAGLALNADCSVTGTPVSAGSSPFLVQATDSGNPAQNATGPQTITIRGGQSQGTPSLTLSSPPAGTVNQPYTGTIPVTGGTAPYACSLVSGTLPAGLTLNPNCTLTGTPATAGTQTVNVQATDSGTPRATGSGNVIITIHPASGTLSLGDPAPATVNIPYSGTVQVSGGTAPYRCSLTSGTMPAGLALNQDCSVTGTPTVAGSTTVQVAATDATRPTAVSGNGPVTITVQPAQTMPLTFTGSMPNGVVNHPYTHTLTASGGRAPYTYALTAGALPNGLTLSPAGVVSGTPTMVGGSSFTITATDSQSTPQTASLPLTMLVTYPPSSNNAMLSGPYAFLFQGHDDVVAGVLAYRTATVGSMIADGNGAITDGEQDSNHQLPSTVNGITSHAAGSLSTRANTQAASALGGTTVPTRKIMGAYTIGPDMRGSLTITPFNADGTAGATRTYAIALRAPVAPAIASTTGSMIEFDGDQLVGTKGSGRLVAQTASALANGLNGSYAFGLSGETPCLPSCTVGIDAGPVATVGQFSAATGAIAGGTSDTNIASTNVPNSALSGTYSAADAYGRVQLNLNSASLSGVPFPTNFAAYVVDGSHVLMLSTDKHDAYILQAGTATLQSQPSFSNASLGGNFVGWENSTVNPGLLGTTLLSTLNLGTAMAFQGGGNGSGTCATRSVDFSGTAGVINGLTGLVNAPVVTALLGSYQSLGNSACTVAANGRAMLEYPSPSSLLSLTLQTLGLPVKPAARVVYLSASNQGYMLETGYAALGMLEAQTVVTAAGTDLNGTYVYGTAPASTLATMNTSGVVAANGAGNLTATFDRNVGVGTINVLQLASTASATYNVTNPATGRFLVSTGQVLYEINPGTFALLQPEALNTSPYVALMY